MGERGERGDLPNAGDLAIVVKACCCCALANECLGVIALVESVYRPPSIACRHCGAAYYDFEVVDTKDHRFIRAWCRRIPPLSELESIDTVTELEREQKVSA